MESAYVMINCVVGKEKEVLKRLLEISGVKEAHIVYGAYDIVTLLEEETMQELRDTINTKIRRFEQVLTAMTMIVVKSY
jgi:DNA-binding Lrp family transcriptional regulator